VVSAIISKDKEIKQNEAREFLWTTLITGYFTIDYHLVRFQLRTKLRTMFIPLFI
jgi:hypothetical protein